MNRRDFVRLMGLASGATALSACGLERKSEKLIPYVVPPDDGTIPRVASYIHTTSGECPEGCGVAAKVVDYRVGKLEGIAAHPVNDGALCARSQAALGKLYHPGRLTSPMRRDPDGGHTEITWDEAFDAIIASLKAGGGRSFGFRGGRRNVFLSRRTTGSVSALIDEFCAETNVERLPEFEIYSYAAIREANRILFGRSEIPSYRFEEADFLLTIGADIIETFVSPTTHLTDFGRAKQDSRFSWYHVEPHMSLTGGNAKERFVLTPGSEVHLLAFLLRRISRNNVAGERHISGMVETLENLSDRGVAEKTGLTVEQVNDIAEHLLKARKPLLIAGGVSTMQSSGLDVAVLSALLQWATGMIGSTVDFARGHDYDHVGSLSDIADLGGRLSKNHIGVLILADTDLLGAPAARAALDSTLENAKLSVGLGQFMTATLEACDIVLPLCDNLESWGDCAPVRGLLSVIQPVVEPSADTRTVGDILLGLTQHWRGGDDVTSYQQYVFNRWQETFSDRDIERLLSRGFLRTEPGDSQVELDRDAVAGYIGGVQLGNVSASPALFVVPSLRAHDGRSRELTLLSEVPDPLTTVSYGAWLSVSKTVAGEKGLNERDEVEVSVAEWSQKLPVIIQPGLPRAAMTIQYNGSDPCPSSVVSDSGEMNTRFDGVEIRKTGVVVALPVLSGSKSQEGRGVIPEDEGHEGHEGHHGDETLYPKNEYVDYRWAMAIDLDLCVGCNACAVACYVENNVAVTGREDHLMGRELSWMHIEPYYDNEGRLESLPMLCQHCSNAPCESVCPVFATYHNREGLNAQVYNRCVGTRYCANNCPYKVRRFNWFDTERPSATNPTRNPEVSVRGRGIMEKCSFCVQRIRKARDTAKDEDRKIRDDEVVPACAQTCPTNSIVFGNLLDENSEVSRWAKSDRSYRVLEGLGTESAVHYLKSKWKKSDHA